MSLSPGWNQIGEPVRLPGRRRQPASRRQRPVVLIHPGAGSASLVSGVLYRYDNAAGQYAPVDDTGVLTPGVGYWLYATQAVTLKVPPP